MNKLSVKEFWCLYSKKCLEYKYKDELPICLSFSIFLDSFFGKLTIHDTEKITTEVTKIKCIDCAHYDGTDVNVCDTHIGIISGLIEKHFNISVKSFKATQNEFCLLEFNKIK
jgi:hypothetical protein